MFEPDIAGARAGGSGGLPSALGWFWLAGESGGWYDP